MLFTVGFIWLKILSMVRFISVKPNAVWLNVGHITNATPKEVKAYSQRL